MANNQDNMDFNVTKSSEDFQSYTYFDFDSSIGLAFGSIIVMVTNMFSFSYVTKTYDTSQILYYILKTDAGFCTCLSLNSFLFFVYFSIFPKTSQLSCFLYLQGT